MWNSNVGKGLHDRNTNDRECHPYGITDDVQFHFVSPSNAFLNTNMRSIPFNSET